MEQELLDPVSRLALHVFRVQQSLSTVGDELTACWGMTSAKWKVLGAIDLSAAAPSASAIGRIMGMTRQAASKQIGLLVQHKLLIPHDDPHDARAAVYTLSPKGKSTYDAISAAWAEHVQALSTDMNSVEIASALRVLEQLASQLEKVPLSKTSKSSKSRNHQGNQK